MGGQRQPTEKGRERRQALLAYASERFAEVGYHPTSVADIVDGVGMGKGAFYWYFDSKEALLREILRDALTELQQVRSSAIEGLECPLDQLEAIVSSSLHWLMGNPAIFRIIQFGWTEDTFASAMLKGRDIMVSSTTSIVEDALKGGYLATGSPSLLATGVHGVIMELASSYHRDPTLDRDEMVETGLRVCLSGLIGQAEV